jgi:hypothetical protein
MHALAGRLTTLYFLSFCYFAAPENVPTIRRLAAVLPLTYWL